MSRSRHRETRERAGWGGARLRSTWAALAALALGASGLSPWPGSAAAAATTRSVEVEVAADEDDAEETAEGRVYPDSTDLELVTDGKPQTVGIRFRAVTVPRGARVVAAWVQFTVDERDTAPCSLRIRAVQEAAPTAFRGWRGITIRPTTANFVGWNPRPWPTAGTSGAAQRTPDLAAILQPIFDRADWAAGNPVALVITGSGRRVAEAREGRRAAAARLHIEYAAPPDVRFAVIGDFGTGTPPEATVASLVASLQVDFIVTAGDNIQHEGSYDDLVGAYYASYIGAYGGTHGPGAAANRFFPALGNHDYWNGGDGANYYRFFTLPGAGLVSTSGTERYYDFTWGPVQFFVLDAYDETAVQRSWLKEALAASVTPWQIVVGHYPPYSSGGDGSSDWMQWPYESWGADAVLSGHSHQYERIMRDDDGDSNSIPYVVVGPGGAPTRPFGLPVSGSTVRYSSSQGAMVADACDAGITFTFHSLDDGLVDRFVVGASCPPRG